MSLTNEMEQPYNRDGCHPDWIRKSLVDSGLNTPQSLSRWSIDSSDHAGEKFPLSRPQSPHSRDNGSRHENEGTHADRQAGEPFPSQVDKRPSLPPLRPFLGELAFSPPHSPPLSAQVDHRIHSINLPAHKALAFYPSNAGRLERPDSALSPPDSPASAPLSLPERTFPLTRSAPNELAGPPHYAPNGPIGAILGGDAHSSGQFPASRAQLERRASVRSRHAGYHPYEGQPTIAQQRPRGLSTPVVTRDYNAAPTPYGGPGPALYHIAGPPDGRYHVPVPRPGMEYYGQYGSGHYDYSLARTRKRSNLPKHSTEIMKKWFDENIESPYPSEEQKRQFAAAANINLTQVSNWFINHRRRCPELRNRREKVTDLPAHAYEHLQ